MHQQEMIYRREQTKIYTDFCWPNKTLREIANKKTHIFPTGSQHKFPEHTSAKIKPFPTGVS